MKPKIIIKHSYKENPYNLFYNEKTFRNKRNIQIDIPSTSRNEIKKLSNSYNRSLSTHNKPISLIFSIAKSLKSVALSSKLYGKYINYYSNLTQEHTFKTPRIDIYPLLKNKKFLSVKSHPLTERENNKDKTSDSKNRFNSIFLSYMKVNKQTKKVIQKKPYGFKYGETKIKYDRLKTEEAYKAGQDFGELCEKNLYESNLLKQIRIKKIDINNCFEEKQKIIQFFCEYINKIADLKEMFNEKHFHRTSSFNGKTAIRKENIDYNLDIYSLCLKFFPLSDINNKNEKECQKIYFPFNLLPLFYLLDFTSFKVLLSEIITYNESNKCFKYIKESLLLKKIKKYCNYIKNSIEKNTTYLNDITYNKKVTLLSLIYDWIVTKNSINEDEEEENIIRNIKDKYNYKCFKLKIILPKIKFSIDNLKIKINKVFNANILAKILDNSFNNWEKFIFFDLFSIKRFKIIINLIMHNQYYKIPFKKIKLSKMHQTKNKDYEFFLSQIGENYSLFYTFIPYIILIVFGSKNKQFQKINLNLKESKNLIKFGKNWGIINTIFKCMFINTMQNKIFFKFDLLDDNENFLYKTFQKENINDINKENNSQAVDYLNNDDNNDNIKVSMKYNYIREKGRDIQTRYKDKMIEISLLNCTFRKIIIASNNSEYKYYKVSQNILDCIFRIKDENEIFNSNYTDNSIMGKYIGENCKLILSAKESNNMIEEKKMKDKSDVEEEEPQVVQPKKENLPEKPITRNGKNFLRLNTFQFKNNHSHIKKEVKKMLDIINNNKAEKKDINKYNLPRGIYIARSSKKKVSITNINELNKNRVDNIERDIIKKRTLKMKQYN